MDAAPSKEALNQAIGEVQEYLETSKDYLKLQAFKMAMLLVTSLAKFLLLGVLILISLLFLSYAAAQELGSSLGNVGLGFLILGGFYTLVAFVVFLMRKRIEKPLLRHFSQLYFKP
ncbi:MAG: hypothetical protein RLZZ241_982 [Bacteroidota bacterium]|jgi:hypothetical protein